jgi:acetyl-CoA synthetase
VINTGGHLVGPFEIESALLEHPAVAESAAVAKPDPVNMEVVKAFVRSSRASSRARPRAGDHELHPQAAVAAGDAAGDRVRPSLPKTRSGKIVRRVLRAKEFGEPVGDLSTLMDGRTQGATMDEIRRKT